MLIDSYIDFMQPDIPGKTLLAVYPRFCIILNTSLQCFLLIMYLYAIGLMLLNMASLLFVAFSKWSSTEKASALSLG